MKVLVIIDVDPDRVIEENFIPPEFNGTIEDAVNQDLAHAMAMGQIAIEDIMEIQCVDSLLHNDADLGGFIRNKMEG